MDLYAEDRDVVPTLKTERLVLRALSRTDLDDVVRLAGDYDVSKMLVPVPHPYTYADAEEFLAMDAEGELDMLWMIMRDDRLVGAVSIGKELGYWLGKEFWGFGYMTEAAIAAVGCYFAHRTIDEIRSSYFVENAGSKRVLEKLGFVDTGPHLHFSNARQAEVAGRSMILTRSAWMARHD